MRVREKASSQPALGAACVALALATHARASLAQESPAPAASAAPGEVFFSVRGGAYEVVAAPALNGATSQTCSAPCTLSLAPGQYRVTTLWAGGGTDVDYLGMAPGVIVRRDYPPPARVDRSVPPRRPTLAPHFVAGVAVASTGAAFGLYGAVALSYLAFVDRPCATRACDTTRTALLASGLVALGLSLPVLFSGVALGRLGPGAASRASRSGTTRLTFAVLPDGAAIGAGGTF